MPASPCTGPRPDWHRRRRNGARDPQPRQHRESRPVHRRRRWRCLLPLPYCFILIVTCIDCSSSRRGHVSSCILHVLLSSALTALSRRSRRSSCQLGAIAPADSGQWSAPRRRPESMTKDARVAERAARGFSLGVNESNLADAVSARLQATHAKRVTDQSRVSRLPWAAGLDCRGPRDQGRNVEPTVPAQRASQSLSRPAERRVHRSLNVVAGVLQQALPSTRRVR